MNGARDKRVKRFLRWQLERYPANVRELERRKARLEAVRVAAPGSAETMGVIAERYALELERSVQAVGYVLERLGREDRELVELVCWRKSHSVEGAAEKLHLSRSAAYRRLDRVLGEIGAELGIVPGGERTAAPGTGEGAGAED